MRNKEVKKRLNMMISNATPDVLDSILRKCEKKRGFNVNMEKSKISDEKKIFKYAFALGLVILVFSIFLGVNQYKNVYEVNSVIEFDVNPSIELEVNKKEDVIKAVALNEDARKILKDMDLENVDLDVAVNAIIGSMLKNGYISVDNNSILVSVKNDDKNESVRLQKEISKEIDSLLKASSINGSVLTQEFDDNEDLSKLSDDHNISVGKAKLINSVIEAKVTNSKGELYTFESLVMLSINELNVLLDSKDVKVDKLTSTGTASQSGYIGEDKAKQIAFDNAGIKQNKVKELEIDFDADNGRLTYEVDFKVGNREYEYDIDAITGDILYKETDTDDDHIETNKNESANNSNKDTTTYITKNKAKSIAFKDAGVSENNVKDLEIDLDDNTYYEIDFKVGNKEYSYDIDAKTGKIIDKEVDIDD